MNVSVNVANQGKTDIFHNVEMQGIFCAIPHKM